MNIIDFDARFTEVLNKWIEENRHRFRRPEDMEDEVPDVYLRWLNTPADWLEGCTPGEYFDQRRARQRAAVRIALRIHQGRGSCA